MPPLYQDPLSAVPGAAWSLGDVARALVEVSCEAWALALIALAVYSFLERDVKDVLKAVAPLIVALAGAAVIAVAARLLGAVPRPLEGAWHAVGPLLRQAFPSEQTTAVAAFATFTALVYGRRAAPVVLAGAAIGLARVLGGSHWAVGLAAGGVMGVALAVAAYGLTLRLAPGGHVARLRAARQGGTAAGSA